MNLKKIAIGKWNASNFASYIMIFASVYKGIHIKTTKNGLPTY